MNKTERESINKMKNLRIFLTSDIHLGLKFSGYPEIQKELADARFETLEQCVLRANEEKCHIFAVGGDMFDKVTVSRNMKELVGLSKQFGKVAGEAHSLQERMSGLYEDMGNILGRYYEIGEERVKSENSTLDFKEDDGYKAFFKKALKKWGVSSPAGLEDKDKKEFVKYIFNDISETYDFLNHFLSCGVDIVWRNKFIKSLNFSNHDKVLDVATGTGDVAFAIRKKYKTEKQSSFHVIKRR